MTTRNNMTRTDVVVIGGTTAGVAAALSAAREGACVLLLAPRPYLGEDICGTLRLQANDNLPRRSALELEIFRNGVQTTPLHVKRLLTNTLLDAEVTFLFNTLVADVIRDADGSPCGVLAADRSGCRPIAAKTIIDATDRAWVCRMAGAETQQWDGGEVTFRRQIITPEGATEHEIRLPMRRLDFLELAEAEQIARDSTYTEGQLRASESLTFESPDPILHRDGDRFRPQNVERLYALSGATVGDAEGIGKLAAARAVDGPDPEPVSLPQNPPTLGTFDIVVIGGGTAGAPAAIAAARLGRSVLVVEHQEGLGGMGTLGLIGKPYHGLKKGFAAEVPFPKHIEIKMEWYRRQIRDAGGTIWLGALGCGAQVEDGRVVGVDICTPAGLGVVRAGVVIDATGNADIARAAGADTHFAALEEGDVAVQGTGMPSRPLDVYYRNSDYLLVDDSDKADESRVLSRTPLTLSDDAFDAGTLIQTRERHRVVGDFTMRYIDQIAGRTYPDSVVFSASDYDSHGYPSARFFALLPHDADSRAANHPAPGGECYTPYRSLLPKGLEGILVAGVGISMDRDASALMRMQFDIANQGYAAGVAASMAVEGSVALRDIDVRALQQHLVETGNLPESVLTDEDNFPLPDATVTQAVRDFGTATNPKTAGPPLAILLTHADVALPMLRDAYANATGDAQLAYAKVLAALDCADGVPTLLAALRAVDAWDDKIFQGHMAEYAHLPTPIDALILALGWAGDCNALPDILSKAETLDADVTLSHHRAVALALEALRDPSAAVALAAVLAKPGMRGHAMLDPTETCRPTADRTPPLREIVLARALYHCGDCDGLGAGILNEYAHGTQALLAHHARDVLGLNAPSA